MPDTIDLSEVVRTFEVPSAYDRRKTPAVTRHLRIEIIRLASGRHTATVYECNTVEVPIRLPFVDTKSITAWSVFWGFWDRRDFYGQAVVKGQSPEADTAEEVLEAVKLQLAVLAKC